jgi:hypothetical protein
VCVSVGRTLRNLIIQHLVSLCGPARNFLLSQHILFSLLYSFSLLSFLLWFSFSTIARGRWRCGGGWVGVHKRRAKVCGPHNKKRLDFLLFSD